MYIYISMHFSVYIIYDYNLSTDEIHEVIVNGSGDISYCKRWRRRKRVQQDVECSETEIAANRLNLEILEMFTR